jgi:hypothetical protein
MRVASCMRVFRAFRVVRSKPLGSSPRGRSLARNWRAPEGEEARPGTRAEWMGAAFGEVLR